MIFDKIVLLSKKHFPDIKIKYKNQSILMKLLRILVFFNPDFYHNFTTTLGNSIYFASRERVLERDLSSSTVLLHELVHVHDNFKHGFLSYLCFNIGYLFPQILVLLSLPILFFSWKLALIPLIFLAPLPAYWRMKAEKRAYFVSMYVMFQLGKKLNVNFMVAENKKYFINQFRGPNYYFMWIFPGIAKEFDAALDKVLNNKKPFEDDILNIIDQIIEQV